MCSTGGGNSAFESFIDVALQTGTGGLLGFKDEKGGIGTGVIGDPLKKGLKDITGATAAEEANDAAREQLNEERAAALQEREDAKAQTAAEQLAASRRASSVRGGTAATTGSRFSDLGGDERDFLGL